MLHHELTPYGGITRIRFKGYDLRPVGPPLFRLLFNYARICGIARIFLFFLRCDSVKQIV